MNLVEALDAALPELPARAKRELCPRLYPKTIAREQLEEGEKIFVAAVPGSPNLYRFSRQQWQLVQLCNGQRNVQQLSETFQQQTGTTLSTEDIRKFVLDLDEIDFWYKTPLELSQRLNDELAEERRKALRSRYADLSSIEFSAWDPDVFLGKLHDKVRFFFSGWYTAAGLALFAFMVGAFILHWSEISNDTLRFYNFTEKSASDLVTFWILLFFVSFMHESAHGISCKHFGAGVHRMGLNLVYLTPCFFVDASESWIFATRWQRLWIILAGMWSEMILCSLATMVWLATPPASFAHELSYNVILITGVGVVVINVNPLIKLDGYYALSELLGIAALKESSTAYVSSWVKRHIFQLPVEVEYVRPRRRWLYVPYALLSGIYSYSLLLFAVRLTYNILRGFSEGFAFFISALLAYKIFKSRFYTLVRFMKSVYLDKKERLHAWFTPARTALIAVAALVLLFAPIWHQSLTVPFLLEASQRAIVRAEVSGTVEAVLAKEGDQVQPGAVLLDLRNLELDSEAAKARADLQVAGARLAAARLAMAPFASAEHERDRLQQTARLLASRQQKLSLTSPISGTIITPRLRDLVGSVLESGRQIAEIDNLSVLRARFFIPEFQMRDLRVGAPVRLKPASSLGSLDASVEDVSPAPQQAPLSLIPQQQYKGLGSSAYYVASATLANPGNLLPGSTGTARIYVGYRSVAVLAGRALRDLVVRRLW